MNDKKDQKQESKLELTVMIDQTVLADWTEFMADWNTTCANIEGPKCQHHPHTTDDQIETYMKTVLRNWHVGKAMDKYK